jgi:hypothetical protein
MGLGKGALLWLIGIPIPINHHFADAALAVKKGSFGGLFTLCALGGFPTSGLLWW